MELNSTLEPLITSPAQIGNFIAHVKEIFAHKPFDPHSVFVSGHAQTLAAYAWPRRRLLRRHSDAERLFEVELGSKILAHCRWQAKPSQCPTLVLVHGIEGSSSSVYMLAMAQKGFRAGFNVVRLNLRNCGGTEHLTPTLYHGGLSQDIAAVVDQLLEHDKLQKLFVVGFSLGGNLVLKLAGEYAERAPREVTAFCAVSPSVNLLASSQMVTRRSNWIYNQDFVRRLKKRIKLKQQLFPEFYNTSKVPLVRTIRDFDELFTAPAHGFAGADDYYEKASSIRVVDQIRVPTLIIHAQDDPFIPFAPLRHPGVSGNPSILFLDPEHGGHVAFISRKYKGGSIEEDRFWAENRVVEFCQLAAAAFD